MSIKTKFIILYVAMIIIPVIFLFWAIPFIGNLAIGNFAITHLPVKFVNVSVGLSINPSIDERELFHLIWDRKPVPHPDFLKKEAFLRNLEKKLNVGLLKIGFIVREQERYLYISPFLNQAELKEHLPVFGKAVGEKGGQFRLLNKTSLIYSQSDFYFRDGTPGSLFVIYDEGLLKRAFGNLLAGLIILLLVLFALVNIAIAFFISRSIVKPLDSLEKAAGHIKDGNLDFEIPGARGSHPGGEIGRLNTAFEEMRCKLKQSLEKQLQYENNRKELISAISHDLRTPVAAIKGYIEGIRDGVANSPEKEAKYIEIITKKASEIEELIEKLFLYSKLDLKQFPFHFEKVRIAGFIADYLEDLQFDLKKRGISITVATDIAAQVTVMADRKELVRVLNNILDNAAKFLAKGKVAGPFITVTLHDTGREIVVGIHDNGPGIAAVDLPRIFERYYQAPPTEGFSNNGSGLGLAISKMIIDGHGGRIWAESESGGGTTVFFTLKQLTENGKGDLVS